MQGRGQIKDLFPSPFPWERGGGKSRTSSPFPWERGGGGED